MTWSVVCGQFSIWSVVNFWFGRWFLWPVLAVVGARWLLVGGLWLVGGFVLRRLQIS